MWTYQYLSFCWQISKPPSPSLSTWFINVINPKKQKLLGKILLVQISWCKAAFSMKYKNFLSENNESFQVSLCQPKRIFLSPWQKPKKANRLMFHWALLTFYGHEGPKSRASERKIFRKFRFSEDFPPHFWFEIIRFLLQYFHANFQLTEVWGHS